MFKRLLLPLLVLTATLAKAQQFGGNPPSVKWKQVNTPAARVIFPQGMDTSAIRIAQVIQRINNATKGSIGFRQKQVNILLQNQTTISNAYVGLAPFRSEFYLTPTQNSFELGSLPWTEQLAIHEFRHVQQYNNFNVGLSHTLKILFGEGGQALGNALSVPNWFFEGDAVFNETLVSQQGRGRLPYFFNEFRSLWVVDRNYSWIKLRNGSYVDQVPNHYPLGYMMVAYGREKYGNAFWKDVTQHAAAFKGGAYPFQKAVKKYSGKSYEEFRTDAFAHFKKQFAGDQPDLPAKKNQHFIANREYPAYVNDSTLVYLKTTYNHIPQFVIRTGKREKAIAARSITNDSYFSYHDGKIVYAAYRPDKRWGYRNYNELVVLNINTGKERRITHKTKYFSPSLSADGKNIIAVWVDASGKSALHILDAVSGKLISVVPNPQNYFITYPRFYSDQQIVSAVRNSEGGMALTLTDINTGSIRYLQNFSNNPIGYPQVQGDSVYFSKTDGLSDRLFMYSISKSQLFEVQDTGNNRSISYYQPAVSASKVAWVKPTAFGFEIAEADKKSIGLKSVNDGRSNLSEMGIGVLSSDTSANLLNLVSEAALPVTNYSKAHNLFNFHSLFPTINDPNYSLALVGQNILNTFQSELSFNYNRNEGYKRIGYDATYGGLFPYISAGADYTFDRNGYNNGSRIYFNETALHAGLRVPLNLSVGKNSTGLSFGSSLYYSRNTFQEPFRSQFRDRAYTYLSNSISFSNQIQQAKQHINPRFAQSISLNYKTAISNLHATQFLASGAVYLPGLSVNHSLVLSGAYQHRGQNNGIGFSNDFPFSKGYSSVNLQEMNKFGLSYHFPIAYPDAGAANLLYILRLRGYLFYDHTHAMQEKFYANGSTFRADFRSAGAAVFFDTKIFNQGSVSFGIRYSYLLDPDLFGDNGHNRIELVLPVSIF
jgi:hypothetical protein